jgi:menaquinone-dependent protoporphyrinogen IX oxidase
MNSVITYKGKYGATKQYAQWLAEELNSPVCPIEDLDKKSLEGYDVIVIGTSVYIGKLQVHKWLEENVDVLRKKKVFLFLVSGTPPGEKEKLMEYIQNNVPKEIIENGHISFLHGRMIFKNLRWRDKVLLRLGASMVRFKNPDEAKRMVTDFDDVKKENLRPLIDLLKSSERLIS